MGTKYSSQSISGYNATPPADDGTQTEANRITWAKIKTKITDPIKTLTEAIDTALVAHSDESVLDIAANTTTTAAHHKRILNVTGAYTISLGDAGTMAAGYIVTVKNSHSAAITVDLDTAADTLDETANGSVTVQPNEAITFSTNAAVSDGYITIFRQIGDDLIIGNDVTVTNDLTVTGDMSVGGAASLEAYSEDADEYTIGSGTIDLDVSVATYFYPSGDFGTNTPTFTFSNPASSGRVTSFTMELLGADGATITWPSVDWANGVEPTWTSGVDVVGFTTRDGGTTWLGFLGGLDFS